MIKKVINSYNSQKRYRENKREVFRTINKSEAKELLEIYIQHPFSIIDLSELSFFKQKLLSSFYGKQVLLRDAYIRDISSILKAGGISASSGYAEFYCPHLKKSFDGYCLILEWEGNQKREAYFHDCSPGILYHVSEYSQIKLSELATTYLDSRIYSPTTNGLRLMGILFPRKYNKALLFDTKIKLQIV
ncbi:hypothetical protein [Sulfurimonas sp.]